MLLYTQVCVNVPPPNCKTINSIISSNITEKHGVDYIFMGVGGNNVKKGGANNSVFKKRMD